MSDLDINVTGLKEFRDKIAQMERDMTGSPMQAAMGKATLVVTRAARKNAPIDRGPLRASILPQVVTRDRVVKGIVGSNLKYAPAHELGTKPFLAPWKPLFEWAMRVTKGDRRHAGALAYMAWVNIAGRGIRAKRYLQRALVDNARRIHRIIGNAVGRIVRK